MRSLAVEGQSEVFDDATRLDSVVEEFQVQALVAQFAVHRLALAILPGRAGLDIQRLHVLLLKPLFEVALHELGPVVATQERGSAMLFEQAAKHLLHVFCAQRGCDLDGMALSGELVAQTQQLEFGSAAALVVNEVIAPDVARIQRLLRHSGRFVLEARPAFFARRHLARGPLPQAMHALDVD